MKTNLIKSLILAGAVLALPGGVKAQSFVYETNFTRNNDIYTNLNEEFPNTGPGTPGSEVGTASASFLFDPSQAAVQAAGYAPDYVTGSNQVNNGVDFELVSDSNGHDFEQIDSGDSITVPVNLAGATEVYVLMASYNGQPVNISLLDSVDSLMTTLTNVPLPDFNGGSINQTGGSYSDQTVFQVHDVGAGGSGNSTNGANNYYSLTEVGIPISPAMTYLDSVTFSSTGYEPLLFGVTVAAVPEPSCFSLLALAGLLVFGGNLRRAYRA
jgi:hypothetical protein